MHRSNTDGPDPGQEPAPPRPWEMASQIVVFRLREREFAFAVATVTEILRMVAIADVPETPEWLPGVINLRGRTVPVIDLRTRFGMSPRPPSLDDAIIIGEPAGRAVGFIVDEVVDVLRFAATSVDPVDELAGETHAVSAVVREEDRLIMVLDPERVADVALDLDLALGIS
ncbi:MAG: chemotaxis protein CheW [Actinobacteria bacterium]|nr:chemotaxis protein CheW [Actinomycetota bacterium]